MATLHVRNVPDGLYEALREAAERDGRSIGAQALKLIETGLFDRGHVERRIRSLGVRRSMFLQRFAETGRQIARRAQAHARELGAHEVTPAHVLLAMLEDEILRRPLAAAGITDDEVRARLPRSENPPPSQVPFSAETKKLLETALRTSLAAHQTDVAPEHLMFAFERSPALEALHLPRGSLARAMAMPEPPGEEYRAVVLKGNDTEWSAQLNELAADGWELFSVTPAGGEVRAILRRS